MTIDELAEKYNLNPEYVRSIIERTEGLAVKNVAYAPKQPFLLPALGVAGVFVAIVILSELGG